MTCVLHFFYSHTITETLKPSYTHSQAQQSCLKMVARRPEDIQEKDCYSTLFVHANIADFIVSLSKDASTITCSGKYKKCIKLICASD